MRKDGWRRLTSQFFYVCEVVTVASGVKREENRKRFVIASEAKQSRVFVMNYGRFADAATPVGLYAVKVVVPRRFAPRNDIEAISRGSL